ncbi:uncharacterized protein LTR77_007470 [Saxophila tyrrhenica]|uniref:AAA+ ATPase domain-containing protein n=1 Tax=Saxophila tyrrhenica TaxID=1690608 RepID=A0AAV9P4V0_9PEZI|nr:hypothetical protein LTR77_007470 [Saxophila tyrrhenica]
MKVGISLRLQEAWKSYFESKPNVQARVQKINAGTKDIDQDSEDNAHSNSTSTAVLRSPEVPTLGYRDECITVRATKDKKGNWHLMKENEQFDPKADLSKTRRATSILDPYCMVVTRRFNPQGELVDTILEIQAAGLVRLIRDLVSYYPDDSFRVGDTIKFDDPPKLLYYYRKELAECKSRLDVPDLTKTHISFALNFLHAHLGARMRQSDEFLAAGMIRFTDLWMLFKPGCLMYHRDTEQLLSLRKGQIAESRCGPVFALTCHGVDYDGEKIGKVESTLQITAFENPRMLSSLSVLPLDHCDDPEAIKAKVLTRAKRFLELRGIHNLQHKTKGRVMIDASTFLRHVVPRDEDRVDSQKKGISILEECKCCCPVCRKAVDEQPEDYDHELREISNDEMLLCSSTVLGFQLSLHKWIQMRIDDLSPIDWSEEAIDRLVMDKQQKKVLSSLISSPVFTDAAEGDVIGWRGRGMVMLLHGQPGTGKTLTAESVCESLKRPLYIVSGGELGATREKVEKTLIDILELSKLWKAVILIDEADVFLEQRSAHDIVRNNFVSVFLRRLEYFSGILILTTNRVAQFDEAFISRIHLAINYPDLEPWMRKAIWTNALRRLDGRTDWGDELEEIAKVPLNGRVIAYSVRTAKAIADAEGEELGVGHLKDVVAVQRRFGEEVRKGSKEMG